MVLQSHGVKPWLSRIDVPPFLPVLLASRQKFGLSMALAAACEKLLTGFEDYAAYQAIAYLPGPHSYSIAVSGLTVTFCLVCASRYSAGSVTCRYVKATNVGRCSSTLDTRKTSGSNKLPRLGVDAVA